MIISRSQKHEWEWVRGGQVELVGRNKHTYIRMRREASCIWHDEAFHLSYSPYVCSPTPSSFPYSSASSASSLSSSFPFPSCPSSGFLLLVLYHSSLSVLRNSVVPQKSSGIHVCLYVSAVLCVIVNSCMFLTLVDLYAFNSSGLVCFSFVWWLRVFARCSDVAELWLWEEALQSRCCQ